MGKEKYSSLTTNDCSNNIDYINQDLSITLGSIDA